MKRCKRYNDPGHAHELTFSCYKHLPLFSNEICCQFLADSIINAKDSYDYHIWAYVFMPEHIHLLVYALNETYSISSFLKAIKQSVSRKAIRHFKDNDPEILALLLTGKKYPPYHFWFPGGGYDRNLTSKEAIANSVNYIHRNPIRRGMVENPEDYKWSSYREWIVPGSGPIPVDREFFPTL